MAVQAWFEVPSAAGQRQVVRKPSSSIGRADDADLRFEHRTVHRRHALLKRGGESEFVIEDVSGPNGNGVKVNGQRVPSARLSSGDEVQLGELRIRFHLDREASADRDRGRPNAGQRSDPGRMPADPTGLSNMSPKHGGRGFDEFGSGQSFEADAMARSPQGYGQYGMPVEEEDLGYGGGTIGEFWRGERSLAETFWLWHVLIALVTVQFIYFGILLLMSRLAGSIVPVVLGYPLLPIAWFLTVIPLWRLTEGRKRAWPILTRLYIICGTATFAFIMFVILGSFASNLMVRIVGPNVFPDLWPNS